MKMILIIAVVLLSGCGYTRPVPPADPNQALLMIMQQRTLERSMKNWDLSEKSHDGIQNCPAVGPVETPPLSCDSIAELWNKKCMKGSMVADMNFE